MSCQAVLRQPIWCPRWWARRSMWRRSEALKDEIVEGLAICSTEGSPGSTRTPWRGVEDHAGAGLSAGVEELEGVEEFSGDGDATGADGVGQHSAGNLLHIQIRKYHSIGGAIEVEEGLLVEEGVEEDEVEGGKVALVETGRRRTSGYVIPRGCGG